MYPAKWPPTKEEAAMEVEATRIRARRIQAIIRQYLVVLGRGEEVYMTTLRRHARGVCNVGPCPKDSWAFLIIRRPVEPEEPIFLELNERGAYREGQEIIAEVAVADWGGMKIYQPMVGWKEGPNWQKSFNESCFDDALTHVFKTISLYDFENHQAVLVDKTPWQPSKSKKKPWRLFG